MLPKVCCIEDLSELENVGHEASDGIMTPAAPKCPALQASPPGFLDICFCNLVSRCAERDLIKLPFIDYAERSSTADQLSQSALIDRVVRFLFSSSYRP